MSDYPDGVIPTSVTIDADTTGLAKDIRIYNATDALSVYDHLKRVRTQIDTYLVNLDIALSELKAVGTAQTPRTLSELYDQLAAIARDSHIYNSTDGLSIYDQAKAIKTHLEYSSVVNMGLDETVAQETSHLNTLGHSVISVYMHATAATTFYIDASPDNSNWFNYYTTAGTNGEKDHSEDVTKFRGFAYWRLRSDAAGSAGDTVDLIISAK